MTDYKDIVYQVQNRVAIVTMNRPEKLNNLGGGLEEELRHAFRECNADPDVRVVVITGAGRAFSSGADVNSLQQWDERRTSGGETAAMATPGAASPLPRYMEQTVEKPVIAAINGVTAGAGYGLALASDIRIASEQAVFHHVYLRRALVASAETWLLPRLIGLGPAMYHVLTADAMDAQEALRLNLVVKVVPHGQLMEETLGLAERIAAGPPTATKYTKKAIYKGMLWDYETTMEYVGYTRSLTAGTGEPREGFAAFLEKRRPSY